MNKTGLMFQTIANQYHAFIHKEEKLMIINYLGMICDVKMFLAKT